MKKLLALLLSVTLVFALAACAEETPAPVVPLPPVVPGVVEDLFPDYDRVTGFVDFKFADAELRHTFFAAAEKFLLDEMVAGIPLYANSSFNLYSERLQTPLREYIPVMGFGTGFSTMSVDDSQVEFEPGVTGVAGQYTYRIATSSNPDTFNQWIYQDSISSDVLSSALGALYYFDFNATRDGYEIKPDMASALPVPVDATTLPTGAVVSTKWRVPIAAGLEFFFHPSNTVAIPAGSERITAQTFVDTFELALKNKWFRAISGGGSFMGTSTTAIVSAEEFSNGLVPFSDVGLKVVNGNEIEFTFIDLQSEWNVKYWLSSFVMTPIHIPLYEALGGVNGTYGTSAVTTAYTGAHYISVYEADKVVRLADNPKYNAPERYFFTGINFLIITDPAIRFEEFVAGRLDAAGVPAARFEEFRNDPRIRPVPGATTFRLNYNAAGSIEAMEEQWEVAGKGNVSADADPKPLLASKDFRTALYFAVDRETLSREILKSAEPMQVFFTPAYLVEPELGINFRGTSQGLGVAAEYSPATYGYNFDAARALFEQALAPLVADGTYRSGDVITLTYATNAGSEFDRLTFEFLQDAFESTFVSSQYNISVVLELIAAPFPQNYFNYIIPGVSDLGTGGISGGTLNASSFLAQYRYDNAGGFTLNWGIDTREATIPVVYEVNGVERKEVYSFDAIHKILNGRAYIVDGKESFFPTARGFSTGEEFVSFEIARFLDPAYRNIRYTITLDGQPVAGFENVRATSRFVNAFGLQSGKAYALTLTFELVADGSTQTSPASFTTK
jgi:ABC-type oligopeptide transport system substrate-binding subunit